MSVLVTGGAGYIGSHVVLALRERGVDVVVIDDLSTGHREAIEGHIFYHAKVSNKMVLEEIFNKHKIEAVMHFAGSIIVSESFVKPFEYYNNNAIESYVLLETALRFGVKTVVFSSTAAVYGEPESGLCNEDSILCPINPYGRSKLMVENFLRDLDGVGAMRSVCLRYFNVAGAEGRIGQSFPQPTHLINICSEAALKKRSEVVIYGQDYPTPDKTCVRDYVHVCDLARAHVAALDYLNAGGKTTALNCGYQRGYSVREIIGAVKRVSGTDFPVRVGERRRGDPATLIAQTDKIKTVLDWTPQFDDIDLIIRSSIEWERKRRY